MAMKSQSQRLHRMQDFRELPGHLIRRLHQVSVALFAEECAGLDITPVQYAVLFVLQESPGMDATRLSEQVFFDRSTLGAVLDRLEKKGVVTRSGSVNDRRVKVLHLTPLGRRLLRKASGPVQRVQQRLLEPLEKDERRQLQALLSRLAELHRVPGPSPQAED